MPRKTRMYLPGVPAHIVQRGHNRSATFFCDDDYRYYLKSLAEGLFRYGGELHAYCLMTNHVHLLITPDFEDTISRVLQHVGRQYVQYVNKTYKRSGSLWEGRHKGSLVDSEAYLLACYRYIEMNPVKAKMVNDPADYLWSSYCANTKIERKESDSCLITPHAAYLSLGANAKERAEIYQSLFDFSGLGTHENFIGEALSSNHVTGDDRFAKEIACQIGRAVGQRKRGRPRKVEIVSSG